MGNNNRCWIAFTITLPIFSTINLLIIIIQIIFSLYFYVQWISRFVLDRHWHSKELSPSCENVRDEEFLPLWLLSLFYYFLWFHKFNKLHMVTHVKKRNINFIELMKVNNDMYVPQSYKWTGCNPHSQSASISMKNSCHLHTHSDPFYYWILLFLLYEKYLFCTFVQKLK